MKMWKKAASVMLASAMVFSLAACGSSGDSGKSGGSSDSDTFKIGGIGPTTGDAAIYGTAVKNGIQLAVDEINAAGGINGKQIRIVRRHPHDHPQHIPVHRRDRDPVGDRRDRARRIGSDPF